MPGCEQFKIVCLPGGSVRRKQPQLFIISVSVSIDIDIDIDRSAYVDQESVVW